MIVKVRQKHDQNKSFAFHLVYPFLWKKHLYYNFMLLFNFINWNQTWFDDAV